MENQLDISSMSVESLESLAYRLIVQRENIQQNLNLVQGEIVKKSDTKLPEEKVNKKPKGE